MRVARIAWADLPTQANALFGGDFFSTLCWYQCVVDSALPPGAQAECLCVEQDGTLAAVLPMQSNAGRLSGLTTPYTVLWRMLLAPGCDVAATGRAIADFCRGRPVRLDALDEAAPEWRHFSTGLRAARIFPLPFAHFGNWRFPGADRGWEAYLAGRPGNLREAIRRRTKHLISAGAAFKLIDSPSGLDEGIAAYETVYAKSWKTPEPFPHFNPSLMRACAPENQLRLGILSLDGQILAAQFWIVHHGTATVLKLAHDAATDRWSPGTVLTGWMIQHLITQDRPHTLDFGRGDDAYKQLWTSHRQQRSGLILAGLTHPAGAYEIAKHAVRASLKRGRASAAD